MDFVMFVYLFVCLCLSGIGVSAFPRFNDFLSDSPWARLPTCSRINNNPEPCDYAIKTIALQRNNKGELQREEVIYEAQTETCTCPNGITCPKGWVDAPDRSITRSLLSTGKRVEYKMNYCFALPPVGTCEDNQVAVVMSGFPYPDTIETVNCSCPNERYDLHLKRAYYRGIMIINEFVCNMRTCNMNDSSPRVCKKIKKDGTTEYRCLCPEEYECRMQPSDRKGYCESRIAM